MRLYNQVLQRGAAVDVGQVPVAVGIVKLVWPEDETSFVWRYRVKTECSSSTEWYPDRRYTCQSPLRSMTTSLGYSVTPKLAANSLPGSVCRSTNKRTYSSASALSNFSC